VAHSDGLDAEQAPTTLTFEDVNSDRNEAIRYNGGTIFKPTPSCSQWVVALSATLAFSPGGAYNE
jgi:hypothetical protein